MYTFRALLVVVFSSASLIATTITVKEINNESNALLTIRTPVKTVKVGRLETCLDPIEVTTSSATTIETSPIVFAEQKSKLFTLEFVRTQEKKFSGKVVTTLKVIKDGKHVIAKKEQGYKFDQDTYEITITVKPGKGTVIAEPVATIHATYDLPSLEGDWELI